VLLRPAAEAGTTTTPDAWTPSAGSRALP